MTKSKPHPTFDDTPGAFAPPGKSCKSHSTSHSKQHAYLHSESLRTSYEEPYQEEMGPLSVRGVLVGQGLGSDEFADGVN
jgi:hypothetical protein